MFPEKSSVVVLCFRLIRALLQNPFYTSLMCIARHESTLTWSLLPEAWHKMRRAHLTFAPMLHDADLSLFFKNLANIHQHILRPDLQEGLAPRKPILDATKYLSSTANILSLDASLSQVLQHNLTDDPSLKEYEHLVSVSMHRSYFRKKKKIQKQIADIRFKEDTKTFIA
eukprot:m.131997 g.131997  ORF g.131997 m.131997 type:complete len:170 (+) comp23749_c0_seq6:510-1019(+)